MHIYFKKLIRREKDKHNIWWGVRLFILRKGVLVFFEPSTPLRTDLFSTWNTKKLPFSEQSPYSLSINGTINELFIATLIRNYKLEALSTTI